MKDSKPLRRTPGLARHSFVRVGRRELPQHHTLWLLFYGGLQGHRHYKASIDMARDPCQANSASNRNGAHSNKTNRHHEQSRCPYPT